MSESTQNIFLHHIDDTKDNICGSSKKIYPGRIGIMLNSNFWGTIS